MPTGGRRAGSGRPRGSRNKRTIAQVDAILNKGQSPLEYLASIYQNKTMPEGMRIDAAKAAAPYVHPRLANVEMTAPDKELVEMSDAELQDVIRQSREDLAEAKLGTTSTARGKGLILAEHGDPER